MMKELNGNASTPRALAWRATWVPTSSWQFTITLCEVGDYPGASRFVLNRGTSRAALRRSPGREASATYSAAIPTHPGGNSCGHAVGDSYRSTDFLGSKRRNEFAVFVLA